MTKFSTCKLSFKPKSQKNVSANNCYLKVFAVYIITCASKKRFFSFRARQKIFLMVVLASVCFYVYSINSGCQFIKNLCPIALEYSVNTDTGAGMPYIVYPL